MPEQLLKCSDCGKTYRALNYKESREYTCPLCQVPLVLAFHMRTPPSEDEGSDAPVDALVGMQLGECRLIEKLGEGGMGAVFKAEHVGLRQLRAVKVLPQERAEKSERVVQRFLREARALARLEHPGVVKVYNVSQVEGWHYIEMEYVEGDSLQDILDREGKLNLARAAGVVFDVADALAAVHGQGIVHRDVKPANIMLDHRDVVRVIDFGLTKSIRDGDSIITLDARGGIGTPSFMSPEQCDGKPLDGRSDIYSVGATYFVLVTGELPFKGDNMLDVMRQHREDAPPDPRSIDGTVPESVCRIIAKALAKRPEDRYANCQQLLSAMEQAPWQSLLAPGPNADTRRTDANAGTAELSGDDPELAALKGVLTISDGGREAAASDEAPPQVRGVLTSKGELKVDFGPSAEPSEDMVSPADADTDPVNAVWSRLKAVCSAAMEIIPRLDWGCAVKAGIFGVIFGCIIGVVVSSLTQVIFEEFNGNAFHAALCCAFLGLLIGKNFGKNVTEDESGQVIGATIGVIAGAILGAISGAVVGAAAPGTEAQWDAGDVIGKVGAIGGEFSEWFSGQSSEASDHLGDWIHHASHLATIRSQVG